MKIRLITALLLFVCIALSPLSENPITPVRADAPPNSPYTGSGGTIDVFEFARNDSSIFTNGVNNTSFQYSSTWFPAGYSGYQLVTSVSNLARKEDPVLNGDFDKYAETFHIDGSELNIETHNWTLTRNDGRNDADAYRIISSIDNSSGGTPGDCMDITLRYDATGLTTAIANLESEFNYTSTLDPSNLAFSFDIKFSSDITKQDWLYVIVSLEYQASVIGSWQETTDNYNPTSWDHHSLTTTPVNGTVTLRITVKKQLGSKWSDVDGHIYFDNFKYVIDSPSNPSEVELALNGASVSDTGAQSGNVIIYADSSNREEAPLINCWTTSQYYQFSSSFNITFHFNYSMYVKHQSSVQATTSFSAPVDADPTWEVNYSIPMDEPPSGHIGYSFGLYLESLWSLTQVKNDTGHIIIDYSYNASSRFVKIDEGIAQAGDNFSIYATSLNYLLQVYLQKSSTGLGGWTNVSTSDYFIAGEWVRVKASLRPIGPLGNSANISLFYPNQTIWQSDTSPTFHDDNETLTSTGWQIPSIQEADAGSAWVATIAYHNSTQSGMRQIAFAVVIPTRGTEISPVDHQRVIWDDTVLVNVTWQNNESLQYLSDASARIRYVDRNLQVQYEPLVANGLGAYSISFDTGDLSPSKSAKIYVELFRYGYVNATYADGTHLTITINLVNDLDYVMIKPTQLTGPDEYTGETSRDQGYTCQIRFYDSYLAAYLRNDSGIWRDNLRVNCTYYVDPDGTGWTFIGYGNFIPDGVDPTIFTKYDASYGDVEAVKYMVTMRMVGSYDWEYEWQNFTIIIRIVSFATNLDAVRTQIDYPPTGTGDGWSQYENDTDVYIVHLYWNDLFNVTVRYINESTSNGITGATVQILIDSTFSPLTETSNGYYYYILNSTALNLGQTDLYVNATRAAHAAQTIKIVVIVEARATQLTKDYPRSTVETPYDDDFIVRFNFTDTVTGLPAFITDATVSVIGYEAGKFTIQDFDNGTYSITFWGNITENTFDVTVFFSRTNYTAQNQYFEITIRPINTYSSGLAVSGSVPWGENVTIILHFTDSDHNNVGIGGAFIGFSWLDDILGVDYWILDHGNGTYTITLNTSKVVAGSQSFTIPFGFSKIHYESYQVTISFQVRDRLTALYIVSVNPGTSVPWGDTLIITLTYNDTDGGFSAIIGASFTCDWNEFYWSYVYNPTNGAYVLTIRTESRLEGSYTLHIYASKTHYQTFMNLQSFVSRNIQTNYQANPLFIPSQPWGDNQTIRIDYLDLDHGGYIPYAEVDTNWNESYYTIYWFGNGTYLLEINTTCRPIGLHVIQITLSRNHYVSQIIEIDLTLRNILTDFNIEPPYIYSHPWGHNATIRIDYLDKDHNNYVLNALITADWNATYYTIYDLGNGTYLIELNTTCRVPGTYSIEIILYQLHYVNQIVNVDLRLRNIQTTLELEFDSFVYWSDFLYLNATYRDIDNDIILSGGSVTLWLSWASWSIVQIYLDGTYLLQINSSAEDVGLANFTIRFTAPYHDTLEQRVQFTINPLPLYVEVLSTSPWTTEYQTQVNISVRVTDEYGRLMNNTQVSYYWAGLSPVNLIFVGSGTYNITFLANQSIGTYIITIEASNLPNYQTHIGIILLNILPIDSILTVMGPASPVVAGDSFQISANFSTVSGAPLPSATLYFSWAGGTGTLTYISGYTFSVLVNSSGLDAGQYTIYITASHQNVIEQLRTVSVSLIVMPAYLGCDTPVILVEWGDNFTLLVEFYDHNLLPILGANILYSWGNLNGSLQPTGIPGWYNTSLPSHIFAVGVYQLILTCDHEGYQFAMTTIGLNIQPRQTILTIDGIFTELEDAAIIIPLNGTAWDVPRGDILWVYLNFTDTAGIIIQNATGSYSWELGSGVLQFIDGLYVARINLTDITPGLYGITISITRQNFETTNAPYFQLNVIPVPTEITGLPDSISIFTGEAFTLEVTFRDTYHNILLPDGTLYVTILSLGIDRRPMFNNGDGTYTLAGLSALIEGASQIIIESSAAPKYARAQSSSTLIVSLSPMARTAIQAGAVTGVVLIVALLIWLAYARIYSIPWIVRKMRKMSKSIDRGHTPSLSKSDVQRIQDRDGQLVTIMTPSYDASSLAIQPYVIPTGELPEERRSEDDAILVELAQLEGLGEKQKEQLFEQMKKIPAKDRVWFMEDMKRQMAEGRFDYLKTGDAKVEEESIEEQEPEKPGLSPVEQATLVAVLREGLEQFSVISDADKDALVQQLIIMTPEERQATIKKLMARMKGIQLEEPEPKPKLEKRKKKADFDSHKS